VFERDGSATAYLYSIGKAAEEVKITLPEGIEARLYPFDSDEPISLKGTTVIRIEPGKCQKMAGLRYDQLRKAK